MSSQNNTVVAYTGNKEAALYFDHVISVTSYQFQSGLWDSYFASKSGSDMKGNFFSGAAGELLGQAGEFNRLLPPDLRNDKVFLKLLAKVPIWESLNGIASLAKEELGDSPDPEEIQLIERFAELLKPFLKVKLLDDKSLDISWNALTDRYGLNAFPSILPEAWIDDVENQAGDTEAVKDYRIGLFNAQLVDASGASWEQIHTFREDIESQERLRRIRHFFTQNYQDKDQQYISDDLHKRLEDHEAAAKKHGFDLKATALEAMFNSKALRALATASVSTAFGLDKTALVSLATGLALSPFDLGSVAVKIWKQHVEFNDMVARHPLDYIVQARKRLK